MEQFVKIMMFNSREEVKYICLYNREDERIKKNLPHTSFTN